MPSGVLGMLKLGHIVREACAGLRVHDRTGEPCDVCGTPIAQVRLADSSSSTVRRADRGKPWPIEGCRGCSGGGLADVVGADQVPDRRRSAARGYETDWTGRFHGSCEAVVRPADAQQVAAVLRWAADNGRAVHVQAGNTGLVGVRCPRPETGQ